MSLLDAYTSIALNPNVVYWFMAWFLYGLFVCWLGLGRLRMRWLGFLGGLGGGMAYAALSVVVPGSGV